MFSKNKINYSNINNNTHSAKLYNTFNLKSFTSGVILSTVLLTTANLSLATNTLQGLKNLIINPNPFPIIVDNNHVDVDAYNINGFTYLKLADVGKTLNTSVRFNDVEKRIEVGDVGVDEQQHLEIENTDEKYTFLNNSSLARSVLQFPSVDYDITQKVYDGTYRYDWDSKFIYDENDKIVYISGMSRVFEFLGLDYLAGVENTSGSMTTGDFSFDLFTTINKKKIVLYKDMPYISIAQEPYLILHSVDFVTNEIVPLLNQY